MSHSSAPITILAETLVICISADLLKTVTSLNETKGDSLS